MLDERLVEAVHEQADDCPLGDQTHARRFGSDVLKCVKCLLRELKPWEAALMAPLSILESLLLARVGTIAGSFYHLVVDKMQNELAVAMLYACGLYMACIAIEAFSVWLSGYLAVKWRKTLITRLQDRYCTRYAYTKVDSRIDNADQRLTAELAKLCDLLGTVVRLLSGAPIKILYFSWLTHTYVGWKGVAAALAFFLISAAVQQLTAIPLAWAVAEQEKQEGNLRFLHMRLRSRAEDISLAASEGSQAELAALNATLAPVLRNQKKVVRRRALVTATSRTSDYAGALLNYGLVAAVVFSGASEATSAGKMAEFVSNASYFTLSLIYSFTQVLDLAETLGTVAALTVRTVHLLETLPKSADTQKITHDEQTWEDGREMMLNLRLATMLLSPTEMTFLENTAKLEISAHSFSAALGTELIPVFPDLVNEKSCNPIICCLTFQFARGGFEGATPPASLSHDEIDVVTNSEMDRLLETFLRWEASMRHEIAKAGPYWSDSIDPQRGTALHGERGARWSEVAAAHLLLGYNRQDDGVCPLILHPIHGE